MGYFRFCRRGDLDVASLGPSGFEELPSTRIEMSPNDVVLLVKRRMGDCLAYRTIVLVDAHTATQIKKGFVQPSGFSVRRPIGTNVIKNLDRYADRCMQQQVITADACAYLKGWTHGDLKLQPRPSRYAFLNYRQSTPVIESPVAALPWAAPARSKHVKVDTSCAVKDDESEGEGHLPLELDLPELDS